MTDLEMLYDLVWIVQKRIELGERLSEGDTPVNMGRFEEALIYARNQNEQVNLTELPFWQDGNVDAKTPREWFEGLPEDAQQRLEHGIGQAEYIYTLVVGQYAKTLAHEYGKCLFTPSGESEAEAIGEILCATPLVDAVAAWQDHLFATPDGREILERFLNVVDL